MVNLKQCNIAVIAYHYIRPIKKSKYKNLKGMEIVEFRKQLDFFKKNYNILNFEDFNEIINNKTNFPKKPSVLLTFDDGYSDHYNYVFPELIKKKIKGIFYPPTMVIENKLILDVNKLHFILAKEKNRDLIISEIKNIYKKRYKKEINFNQLKFKNLKSRFDDKKTTLIKRTLQYVFPQRQREFILKKLFNKVMNIDEKEFSKEIYLSRNDVSEMYKNGMSFGIHGENHFWWEHLPIHKQEKELRNPINYFKKLNVGVSNISVCYPNGSYNKSTLKILKKLNISFALTTQKGPINKKNVSLKYQLPRYDVNDTLQ